MNDAIALGRVTVSSDGPVVIIAEAACEHLGDLDRAMRMVDAAKAAGVDVIKFQLHLPDEMIPGSVRFWGGSMDDVIAQYELGPERHESLMHYCEDVGIQYLCTPFSTAAAEILDRLGVIGFKTGSGELTNLPMQRAIARLGKPMIVSTGMATEGEVDETVAVLRDEHANFMLTHCTSAYPPAYDEINLRYLPTMMERYDLLVGLSDHTPELWTALGAVALGAPLIEKHFTLDKALRGPDWHVSLEPDELTRLVDAVRKLEAALGSEKRVHPDEQAVREWAHHSVAAVRAIARGERIGADSVTVKRPGTGIPAKHLEEVVGRVAAREIPTDRPLVWEDLAPA
ncbi:MAG: N-acetylneuraminate synthase family protein [Gaiellaceae bacterium]